MNTPVNLLEHDHKWFRFYCYMLEYMILLSDFYLRQRSHRYHVLKIIEIVEFYPFYPFRLMAVERHSDGVNDRPDPVSISGKSKGGIRRHILPFRLLDKKVHVF